MLTTPTSDETLGREGSLGTAERLPGNEPLLDLSFMFSVSYPLTFDRWGSEDRRPLGDVRLSSRQRPFHPAETAFADRLVGFSNPRTRFDHS